MQKLKKSLPKILLSLAFSALFCTVLYYLHVDRYVRYAYEAGELNIKYKIKVEMLEYNHLGRDLVYKHKLNGTHVASGGAVKGKAGMDKPYFYFITEITEKDSIPDTAMTNGVFVEIDSHFSSSATSYVTVEENGGRKYKDAYAKFKITYTVIPDPPFWKVLFYFR